MKEHEIDPGDRVRHLESGHVGTVDAVIRHQQGVAVRIDWDSGESGGYVPRVLIPASLPIPDGFAVAYGNRRRVSPEEDAYWLDEGQARHSPLGDSTGGEVWILRRVEPADPLAYLRWEALGSSMYADEDGMAIANSPRDANEACHRHNGQIDTAHARGERQGRERAIEEVWKVLVAEPQPSPQRMMRAVRDKLDELTIEANTPPSRDAPAPQPFHWGD